MEESNPTFILRNWIAHDCIAAAEAGDFSRVSDAILLYPFHDRIENYSMVGGNQANRGIGIFILINFELYF